MITLTRLDGATVFVNERNIQWVEVLPDTAITFVAGARLLVRESAPEVLRRIEEVSSVSPWASSQKPLTLTEGAGDDGERE